MKKKVKKVQRQQSKDLFNLHTASAPRGLVLLSAARLALAERDWYPQTCKKNLLHMTCHMKK